MKNKKGMTLVEVVVAMALLAVVSTMFVVIATGAKKQNLINYYRSTEIYKQQVEAEQYNGAKNYGVGDIKVNKYNGKSGVTNNFDLAASFAGGINWNTTAYGFESKYTNTYKDASFQLKFLQGKDSTVTPDVSAGEYWVKFYNNSGVSPKENYVKTPEITGGKFFDVDNNSCNNQMFLSTMDGACSQFGVILGTTDYFGFYDDPEGSGFVLNSANFGSFCETKDGSLTGFVIIHYMGGNTYRTQAQYDADPTPAS